MNQSPNPMPIAWTIAGSDSGGVAGIQADLKTFHALGVHGCSAITAVTAQTPDQLSHIQFVSITAQLNAMKAMLAPDAIKIGMLGTRSLISELLTFLKSYRGHVILDPVLVTTSGGLLYETALSEYARHLQSCFPHVDLITPNLHEARLLLNRKIETADDIKSAAENLLKQGAKNILIKGGHATDDQLSQDYWTDGSSSFWLSHPRCTHCHFSGTGCTLSSAIAACLAIGFEMKEALVIAKMYVNQSMRLSKVHNRLCHTHWPQSFADLPMMSENPMSGIPPVFLECDKLGLYPIVDRATWLQRLLPLGIKHIQLRIKDLRGTDLEQEIKKAISIAKAQDAKLWINDYWEQAIQFGAYGVHLGQTDLLNADIAAMRNAKLRLGISTHSYAEVARAHAIRPSYIAFGPIFATKSKVMPFQPQGMARLKQWRRMLHYPLVAIGGIHVGNIDEVIKTGVDGIALIAGITKMEDPIATTKILLSKLDDSRHADPA